ncbi:MAG: glycosyltransferase family 9 protein, partial [Bacteroidota bacterium]
SASVVRQAYKVITHDTGMMHIAAAFQKEILSVWGNTIPEFGMYPYYGSQKDRNTTFEVNNLSCRPCSKIGHETCPKGHFKCMELQDTGAIARL